jgi:hypothetical protein
MKQSSTCAVAPATQVQARMADKPIVKSEPFGLRAAWLHFASELEIKRLAKLHMRIQRRKRGLDDLVTERQRIMNRCIRRMRRQNGKN